MDQSADFFAKGFIVRVCECCHGLVWWIDVSRAKRKGKSLSGNIPGSKGCIDIHDVEAFVGGTALRMSFARGR